MSSEPVFPSHETLTSIKSRRSIRTFTKQQVPDELIHVLLQSANDAPSAHNQAVMEIHRAER